MTREFPCGECSGAFSLVPIGWRAPSRVTPYLFPGILRDWRADLSDTTRLPNNHSVPYYVQYYYYVSPDPLSKESGCRSCQVNRTKSTVQAQQISSTEEQARFCCLRSIDR
jgi:hypothetical protein